MRWFDRRFRLPVSYTHLGFGENSLDACPLEIDVQLRGWVYAVSDMPAMRPSNDTDEVVVLIAKSLAEHDEIVLSFAKGVEDMLQII